MIYKASEVIYIFLAGGRTDGQANERTNEGVPRGPRGPKKCDFYFTGLSPEVREDYGCQERGVEAVCLEMNFDEFIQKQTKILVLTNLWREKN